MKSAFPKAHFLGSSVSVKSSKRGSFLYIFTYNNYLTSTLLTDMSLLKSVASFLHLIFEPYLELLICNQMGSHLFAAGK